MPRIRQTLSSFFPKRFPIRKGSRAFSPYSESTEFRIGSDLGSSTSLPGFIMMVVEQAPHPLFSTSKIIFFEVRQFTSHSCVSSPLHSPHPAFFPAPIWHPAVLELMPIEFREAGRHWSPPDVNTTVRIPKVYLAGSICQLDHFQEITSAFMMPAMEYHPTLLLLC